MQQGLQRFDNYLTQLQNLFAKASKQKNAAGWLYKNNARTPLFMLEALAKLYVDVHNKKKFTKLKEQFKQLEDGFGQIDYYNWLIEEFATNKLIDNNCKQYLKNQLANSCNKLNEILVDKEWLSNKRIEKIKNKLQEADWKNEKEEITEFKEFYGEAIIKISAFVKEKKFVFTNIEEDVHELRRKLRWLSIYPQALQGCIQYKNSKTVKPHLKKYCTKEIVNSPFNKLPLQGINKELLFLDKNYFFSLSYMISELGKLKDEGLTVMGLKEAIQQTQHCTDEEAYKKAYTILGKIQPKISTLLKEAEKISKTFFAENNLEHLIAN